MPGVLEWISVAFWAAVAFVVGFAWDRKRPRVKLSRPRLQGVVTREFGGDRVQFGDHDWTPMTNGQVRSKREVKVLVEQLENLGDYSRIRIRTISGLTELQKRQFLATLPTVVRNDEVAWPLSTPDPREQILRDILYGPDKTD